ncbi:hypothetical protein GON03_19455 [Nocardioides sp. MAH-18]|uniref:Uncharacterized protein n=1 Tax=Nocardioides agri TaxID=2682843 RepID=A0A6L6XXF6_9ACTN|nr:MULTISPECIES: hypothetical protein [unclassified Nocardioides]MBA2952197.1 hypothetical protein [Nocardioides sp. CGMCC 1.13656]MVQ51363.1 hypothetical protein [Nocardioides sp. MAH-18]
MSMTGLPPAPGFMAAPAVPLRPANLPDAAYVAAIAGADLAEPLTRINAAYAAASTAVVALDAARPGGNRFTAELAADVADRVAGRTAKTLRVDRLVEGDRERWAETAIACKAAPAIQRAELANLDKTAIGKAARKAADQAAAEWAAAAASGWIERADHLVAWTHRRAGEEALGTYGAASRLWEWCTGAPGRTPPTVRLQIPDVDALPPIPTARGQWLALERLLRPTTWLNLPTEGIVWPDDAPDIAQALPETGRQFADLANHGSWPVVPEPQGR